MSANILLIVFVGPGWELCNVFRSLRLWVKIRVHIHTKWYSHNKVCLGMSVSTNNVCQITSYLPFYLFDGVPADTQKRVLPVLGFAGSSTWPGAATQNKTLPYTDCSLMQICSIKKLSTVKVWNKRLMSCQRCSLRAYFPSTFLLFVVCFRLNVNNGENARWRKQRTENILHVVLP